MNKTVFSKARTINGNSAGGEGACALFHHEFRARETVEVFKFRSFEKVHVIGAYMVHWTLKTPPMHKMFEKNISSLFLTRLKILHLICSKGNSR